MFPNRIGFDAVSDAFQSEGAVHWSVFQWSFQSRFPTIGKQPSVKRFLGGRQAGEGCFSPSSRRVNGFSWKLAWKLEESRNASAVPEIEKSDWTHFSRHSDRIETAPKLLWNTTTGTQTLPPSPFSPPTHVPLPAVERN